MQPKHILSPISGAALSGLLLWAFVGTAQAETERWYTQSQVNQGADVYTKNCAECHGANAEATPNWRTVNPDGKYPPPPLNGSAHAWHHPLDMLRGTVRKGGAPVGGVMPPFGDKLTARDIDAAIAFFQDKWPNNIYAAWLERNGGAPRSVQANLSDKAPSPITAKLRQAIPTAAIGEPEATPLAGIHQVKLGKRYAYLSEDGRFALVGDLLDLEKGINLTEIRRSRDNSGLLAAFPEKDMVVYPATGVEQARITVFTDPSCPYCRKLHKEIPQLQQAGVTVRYIAYPRAGTASPVAQTMRSVWCAKDRRQAMDAAKSVGLGELGDASCAEGKAVDAGYRLSQQMGLTGTPAIVLPDGSIQPGYMPAPRLLARLGLAADGSRLSSTTKNR